MHSLDTAARRTVLAIAIASLVVACGRPTSDRAAPDVDATPVADVEGTALPPTVHPAGDDGAADDLDWSVEGHDAIASASADEARDAARGYIGRDADAVAAADAPGPGADGTDRDVATAAPPATPPRGVPGASGHPPARAEEPAAPVAARAGSTTAEPPRDADVPAARDAAGARALNQRAIALINAGRPDGAIPLLERAVAAQPRDAEMLGNLGYAYLLTGRHERASARLQAALDLAPSRSATWLNLGQTYAELGRRDTAVDAVLRGYRYSTRKASVRSALQRAARGERYSTRWREAAALALDRIDG